MADEVKKDKENEAETGGEKKEEKKVKPKKEKQGGGSGATIGLLLIMIIISIGIIALLFLLFQKLDDNQKLMKEQIEQDTNPPKVLEEISPLNLDIFKVVERAPYNIKTREGESKILVITISLGLNIKEKKYKKLRPEFDKKLDLIKQEVEKIITTAKVEDLESASTIYNLQVDIANAINQKFDSKMVATVYFTDKLIQ